MSGHGISSARARWLGGHLPPGMSGFISPTFIGYDFLDSVGRKQLKGEKCG